jgi:hypothetical protein
MALGLLESWRRARKGDEAIEVALQSAASAAEVGFVCGASPALPAAVVVASRAEAGKEPCE